MRLKNALAKTPVNGITIGGIAQDDHGQIVIRIKKPGCNIFETLTLEQLLIIIFETAQTVA